MGYYSTLEGELIIRTNDGSSINAYDVTNAVMENPTFSWALDGVTPSVDLDTITYLVEGDEGKYYNLNRDLEDLISWLEDRGFNVNGYIIRVGEENGDIEKLTIKNGEVTIYTVKIIFGDGTEYKP